MPRFRRRRGDTQLDQRNIAQTIAAGGAGTVAIQPTWDTRRNTNVQTREALVAAITNAVAADVGDVNSFPIVAKQLGTDRDVTDQSPWAYALNVSPSQGMTASVLRQHLSMSLDYSGECYLIEIGTTVVPLIGGNVEVILAARGQHHPDGSPALIAGYIVRNATGRELGRYGADGMAVSGLAEGRLIRVYSPFPGDPIKAQSTIEQALVPAELIHFSRQASRALMQNAGWPAGLFRILDEMLSNDQIEEIDRRINSRLNDPSQRGRQFVVKGSTEYEPFIAPTSDGGMSVLTDQARRDVFAVWNMPEARLGLAGGMTYENQRTALGAYYRSTVVRRLNLILSALNQVTRQFGYVLEVDTSEVPELNEDSTSAATRAAALYKAGLVTLDEAREIVGLDPVAGGDTFTVPASTATSPPGSAAARDAVPFDRAAVAGPAQPSPEDFNAAYDAVVISAEETLAEYAQRYHARLYRNIVGRYRRHAELETRSEGDPAPQLDPDGLIDVEARSAELAADLPAILEGPARAVVNTVGDLLGVAIDDTLPRWQAILTRRISRMVDGVGDIQGWTQSLASDVAESVRAGYAAGESTGQIAARIAQTLDVDPANPKAVGNRALTIARTETNGLANETSIEAYDASGVVQSKRWYTVGDARTRESHLTANGQEVPLAAKFIVGGVQMNGPHDPSAPAREVVNCRCRTLPIVRRQP